jgi:hypothetical protein
VGRPKRASGDPESFGRKEQRSVGNLFPDRGPPGPLAFPENKGGYPLPTSNRDPFRKNPTGDPASIVERIERARTLGGLSGLIYSDDIVQSLIPNHGDFRLISAKRAVMQGRSSGKLDEQAREYPTFVAHPNYGLKGYPLAHSLREPKPERSLDLPSPPVPGLSNHFGYFTKDPRSIDLRLQPEYMPDFPIKPWEDKVNVRLIGGLSIESLGLGAISGGKEMTMSMRDVFNITQYMYEAGDASAARLKNPEPISARLGSIGWFWRQGRGHRRGADVNLVRRSGQEVAKHHSPQNSSTLATIRNWLLINMVGRDGFEPSKVKPADLQSAPFGHSGTYPLRGSRRRKCRNRGGNASVASSFPPATMPRRAPGRAFRHDQTRRRCQMAGKRTEATANSGRNPMRMRLRSVFVGDRARRLISTPVPAQNATMVKAQI